MSTKPGAGHSDGLRACACSRWVMDRSSRIQEILGNTPARMAALKKAASGKSGSIVPKYLLGRAYREAGDFQLAIDVLKPVLEAHTDEFRVCVEYALAMAAMGEPYSRCIALLKLSTLYGLSDPRFIATLGGMLFLIGDFSDAEEIFKQSIRREFPAPEAFSIQFRPKDQTNRTAPLCFTGKVTTVKNWLCFYRGVGVSSVFLSRVQSSVVSL